MSLAISAGTVAHMRGYRHANLLYGGGVALSLATGYLRIAADKHWSTDVLTGWIVGAAVGYAVPRYLHRNGTEIQPLASASMVGVAMRW
jgi:membrane-associated phospholipid phosphatase